MVKRSFKQKLYSFFANTGIWVLSRTFPEYFGQDPIAPSDRYVELPFAVNNLPKPPAKILDVGCVGSFFPLILAGFGYEVSAIDLREYSITNKIKFNNFSYYNYSITKTDFPDNNFDAITVISTLEHVGLKGRYGVNKEDSFADVSALNEMKRILKPGGMIIITVPFGKAKTLGSNCRIYDSERVKKIASGLEVMKIEYYKQDNDDDWCACSREDAEVVDATIHRYPLCLLKLIKKNV